MSHATSNVTTSKSFGVRMPSSGCDRITTGFSEAHSVRARGRSQCHRNFLFTNKDNSVHKVARRRASMTEGTVVTTYSFSTDKLINISKSADGVSTGFTYDQYGRVQSKDDGATITSYGYDGNDRVNSIVHTRKGDNYAIHQESYSYDAADNLTYKLVNSVATNYSYDEIDQLKTETGSNIYNIYSYDHNGNRLSRVSAAGTDTYVYDDADKLQSVSGSGGVTNYTYDNCGRPIQIGSKTLTWDYEDQLTNYLGSSQSTSYAYNGIGSRTSKTGPGGTRVYKRDGVGVTASVLSDGTNSMVPGISETIIGGQTKTLHADRMGTMKSMSVAGVISDTADFDAFGKLISRTGQSPTQKGFASGFGYQEDGESGFKLLGHRYYDPETGRFLSRDPAQDGRNWYCYCDNNPLKCIDAAGLQGSLIVHGDDHDVPCSDLGYYFDKPIPFQTRGDKEMIQPSKKDLIEAMIECEGDFYFWGHGAGDGSIIINNKGERITQKDLAYIAAEKKRRGKKKMKRAVLRACFQAEKGEFINAWLGVSEEFTGVCGLTAQLWPPAFGSPKTYNTPQRPGPTPGPRVGDPGKGGSKH